jgi:IS605 OrfB family transposase
MINSFWYPEIKNKKTEIKTNSWFDIQNIKNPNPIKEKTFIDSCTEKILRTRKIEIYPNKEQKVILGKWFNNHIDVYNKTNDFIKSKIIIDDKIVKENFKYINFRNIRDKEMVDYKEELVSVSSINKHLLDEAIKDNVTMYKSATSNMKEKNIKDFRIRPRLKDKRRKNLIIETGLISKKKNGFCISVLGEMKTKDNFQFNEIKKTFTLQYDKFYNKYFLLVPIEIKKVENFIDHNLNKPCPKTTKDKKHLSSKLKHNLDNRMKKDNKCSIDPGVREFICVYSKNEYFGIGNKIKETFKPFYKKIDKITSLKDTKKINEKKYKRAITKVHEKVSNKIKDLHWKASNFLCKKFNTICIGKLSTRSIVNNETSNIKEITKRELYTLSHFSFRKILKDQCEKFNCIYKEINEYETSKRCHKCNKINNVGSSKIYKCDVCEISLDRDINASINIYKKDNS